MTDINEAWEACQWDGDASHIPLNERIKVWAELMLSSEAGAQRKIEEARNGFR